MNGNGRLTAPAQSKGLFVPKKYAKPPVTASDRSLQINIDSEDDAKSVIQNLGMIKAAWQQENADSVEFCIAENVAPLVENTLLGAINWCRTYKKHIKPNDGNVLFALPSYKDFSVPPYVAAPVPKSPESSLPVAQAPATPVKPQRPVRADSAKA